MRVTRWVIPIGRELIVGEDRHIRFESPISRFMLIHALLPPSSMLLPSV